MSPKKNAVDEIFRDDPLLLKAESQAAYGKELLENVLLMRTSKFGLPRIVDLHDPATYLPSPNPEQPPQPTPDLAKRYLQSIILREKLNLTQEEEDALKRVTVMSRGERTTRRLPPEKKKDPKAKPKFQTHEKAKAALKKKNIDIDSRLRIAAVGTRVRISKLIDKAYLDEDLCLAKPLDAGQAIEGMPDRAGIPELGRTRRLQSPESDARWKRWKDTVCSHIKTAAASGCQIIALPEFGLPPEVDGDHIENQIRDCCFPGGDGQHFSHFIFAGSRHEGGSNRGLVIYHKQGEKPHRQEWHYKLASARALSENILGPRSDKYITYKVDVKGSDGKSFPIHVTPAICFDTFDPSTFLSLVRQSATILATQTSHIILVPSFNPSDDFVELLRDLSFLTGAVVVYVNSLHGDARVFIAGCAVGAVLDGGGATLLAKMEEHLDTMQAVRKAAPEDIDRARKSGDRHLAEQLRKRSTLYRDLTPVLKDLRSSLKDVIDRGGLDHIITVEFCQECKDKSHTDDYGCNADILYYNLDAELLDILKLWRHTYITLDESFIPAPFHYKRLLQAIDEDEERNVRRDSN